MTALYIIGSFCVGFVVAWVVVRAAIKKRKNDETNLKVRSDFLANVSHEIRTPMSGIMGLTDILMDTPLNAQQRDYVSTIHKSCESLMSIVNDVLDFSKIEAGKMKLENIAFLPEAVVREVLNVFKVKADEKKLKLNIDIKTNVPKCVVGDPHRIREILINLVSNAIKFTDQGTVMIELTYASDDQHGEGVLSFAVKDTGVGIAESNLNLLFKGYSQVKSEDKCTKLGTGLGLVISKKLSNLMGGDVVVESRLGKGSVFTLTLRTRPASGNEQEQLSFTHQEIELDVQQLKKLNVLVVEDNPVNLKVLEVVLERLGLNFSIAKSGKEVVGMSMSNHYDVIFMDVIMPDMDGLEVVTAIRHMKHHELQPYIIAMTAAATLEDKESCFKVGMNDYIAKPYTIEVVKRALSKVKA